MRMLQRLFCAIVFLISNMSISISALDRCQRCERAAQQKIADEQKIQIALVNFANMIQCCLHLKENPKDVDYAVQNGLSFVQSLVNIITQTTKKQSDGRVMLALKNSIRHRLQEAIRALDNPDVDDSHNDETEFIQAVLDAYFALPLEIILAEVSPGESDSHPAAASE